MPEHPDNNKFVGGCKCGEVVPVGLRVNRTIVVPRRRPLGYEIAEGPTGLGVLDAFKEEYYNVKRLPFGGQCWEYDYLRG